VALALSEDVTNVSVFKLLKSQTVRKFTLLAAFARLWCGFAPPSSTFGSMTPA
jgi:hypothetical protein